MDRDHGAAAAGPLIAIFSVAARSASACGYGMRVNSDIKYMSHFRLYEYHSGERRSVVDLDIETCGGDETD